MRKKIVFIPGSFKPPHYGHFTLVKKLLQDKTIDKIYVIISPKPREDITAEESKQIWNIYSKLFPSTSKISIMISRLPSPINMVYAIASKLQEGNEIILIKSSKNIGNTRFKEFKKLEPKIKVDEWELKVFKNLSSTNMRKTIRDKNKQGFIKFLPPKLSQNNKEKIWDIVN